MSLLSEKEILLVDGRGCSCVHVVQDDDRVGAGTFRLKGQCWDALPFTVTSERDRAGRLIVRSAAAAIGPLSDRYRRLYLPFGWQPPHGRRV